jgi:hypothetical protein
MKAEIQESRRLLPPAGDTARNDMLMTLLTEHWGVNSFRPLQLEAITAVLQVPASPCRGMLMDYIPLQYSNLASILLSGEGCTSNSANWRRKVTLFPAAPTLPAMCCDGCDHPLDITGQRSGTYYISISTLMRFTSKPALHTGKMSPRVFMCR